MELSYQLLAGATGAFASILLLGIASPLIVLFGAYSPSIWRHPSTLRQITHAFTHVMAGIGLGWVFWVSWGFTAIINLRWWERGLCFGIGTWAVFALPVLLGNAISLPELRRTSVVTAIEWLCTAVCVGTACAWAWNRSV